MSHQKKYRKILGELDQLGHVIHINRVCDKRYELQVNWEIKKQYRKRDSCNRYILKIYNKLKIEQMAKNKETKSVEIVQVPMHLILPDHNNPRANIDESSCMELARSILKAGVISPILIRPMVGIEPLKYIVVYGHRRLWACKFNKMETIPAQIREMSDEEAFEFQIIENLQREDVNPMDESDAFQKLVAKRNITAETIADRIGKSTKYVYDRLVMQKVIPFVQSAVRSGSFTITHAKQFARLNNEDQGKVWESIHFKESATTTPAFIRQLINNMFKLKLDTAIFNTADAGLLPIAGSCLKCTKRSGCSPLLFEDVTEADICFDGDCWKKKEIAHVDWTIEKYKSEGYEVKLLSAAYNTGNELLLPASKWSKSEIDTKIIGIIIEDTIYGSSKYGTVLNLEPIVDLPVHTTDNDTNKPETQINYNTILTDRLAEMIIDSYERGAIDVELMEGALRHTMLDVIGLNLPYFKKICTRLKWDMADADGKGWCYEDILSSQISKGSNLLDLFLLVASLKIVEINSYWDNDDVEMVDSYLPDLKIKSVIETMETEAGKQFIS